jgi:predicted DCC family thiol-disulfide oxidoreductase YuxK
MHLGIRQRIEFIKNSTQIRTVNHSITQTRKKARSLGLKGVDRGHKPDARMPGQYLSMLGRYMTQAHQNDRQITRMGQNLHAHKYTGLIASKISNLVASMKNNPSEYIPDPLVVFDGHCILCNRALQFYFNRLVPTERQPTAQSPEAPTERQPSPHRAQPTTYYTAAQSPWAQRNLPSHVLHEAQQAIQTHHNKHWHGGPAALWMLIARMTYPWRLLLILRLLPRPVAQGLYRFIAQRRYRWFGTQDLCSPFEPPPGHQLLHS